MFIHIFDRQGPILFNDLGQITQFTLIKANAWKI